MGLTVRNGAPVRAQTDSVQLREAVLGLSRAIEDQQWIPVGSDLNAEPELRYNERKQIVLRSRMYAKKNPLAKQGLSLLVNYTLGQGISLTATNKKLVAKIVDEFWENPTNRAAFTSHSSMSEFIQGAATDGMQVLVLFPDKKDGTLEVSTLDSLLVEDVITDPENWRIPLWVKVRKPKRSYNFKNDQWDDDGTVDYVYYRYWRNDASGSVHGQDAPEKVEDGLIYLARRGKGKFGQPDLEASLPWLDAQRHFMEDRATISRAAASIAWKKKRKGGTSDVAAEVERLQSSLAKGLGTGWDTNPPPPAASTIVENDLSNLEWVKTDTGGASADADERKLRMMSGAGFGVMNHYFGDEAQANLATATAMELPMLKMYENWQTWLGDIVHDLIDFALEVAHEGGRIGERDDSAKYTERTLASQSVLEMPGAVPAPKTDSPQPASFGEADVTVKVSDPKPGGPKPDASTEKPPPPPAIVRPPQTVSLLDGPDTKPDPDAPVDWYVDVDFAPIVQKDLASYMQALNTLYAMLPQGNPESVKLIVSMALTTMGVNDIDQQLDRLFPPLGAGIAMSPPPQLLGPGGIPPQFAQQYGKLFPGSQPPGVAGLLGPGKQSPFGESAVVSPARVMRILSAVQETEAFMRAANDSAAES